MDISTGSWFEYLNEEVRLTEGVRDIGLPEYVIDYIEEAMPNASEKAKTFAGHAWKKQKLPRGTGLQFELVNKLIDDYGDYVMADKLSGDGRPTDIAARTFTPYRTGADTTYKRTEYDDEMKKASEQVKFVIKNLKNALDKPVGTWMRSFRKALKNLSKLDIPSEQVEDTKEYLDGLIANSLRTFWFKYDILFAFLNDDATHFEMIKSAEGDINEAYNIAQEYLNNVEDPDNIIHTFDDGYYWYNLKTSNCSVEGERMGHCGGDTRGVLVSLRKKHGRRKESSSYVTMTWDQSAGGATLYQIKGRSNDAPVEDAWPYIDWFVKNAQVQEIHETGEHSSDPHGFEEMNDYLREENPGVTIAGGIESMMGAAEEAIAELNHEFSDLDNCSVWFDEPEDHGMGDYLYVRASAECIMQVDLGWKGFVKEGEEYRPTMGTEGQARYEPDKRIAHNIPVDSFTGDSRDFRSELDVESLLDLPGEDVEVDYEVKMLEGASANSADPFAKVAPTAHLEITARSSDSFSIWSTGQDDLDLSELEYFGTSIRNGFEEEYLEHQQAARSNLAEEGYALKNAWDREKDNLAQMEKDGLENFYYDQQGTAVQFWFRDGPGNTIDNDWDGKISIDVPLYLDFDLVSATNVPRWVTDAFGTPKTYSGWGRLPFFENETLNRQMARQLTIISAQAQGRDRDQLDLPLGREYAWKPTQMALANDTRFLVFVNTKHDMANLQKLPVTTFSWRLLIKVDSNDSAEEFEIVKEVVKLLNKNPDLVKKAANDVLDMRMEPVEQHAEGMKAALLGGNTAMTVIRSLDSTYGASATSGDTRAERIIMIAKWIQDNWEKMDEVQKYVAQTRFLRPMNRRQFRIYNEEGQIEMDDPNNLGKPVMFDEYVAAELNRRGAAPSQLRNYAGGLSEQVESIEDQIARIDNMLQEVAPDIRLYRTEISAVVSDERMEKTKQLEDQLRGLLDITTVNLVGKTPLIGATKVRFGIKFIRRGTDSSPEYVENTLIPLINSDKVPGVRIDPVRGRGWLTPEDVTPGRKKINESSFGQFGGVAGNLSARRPGTRALPTPALGLCAIAADWQDGGVMAYDVAMDTTDMRYHVMMPVEELLPYISREFRAPKDAFDGMYQHFIKNGAESPVYVAIGKNRIKITGGEDLVWFAKRSGLEELPVFLSYQNQV